MADVVNMVRPGAGTANDARAFVGAALNVFLADTYVLLAKTQAVHWNAAGPNFIGLHKLTEAQYGELFQAIDDLAERVRALRVEAPCGLGQIIELSTLDAAVGEVNTHDAARRLAADNTTLAAHARALAKKAEEAKDIATQDMLVARVEVHDKAAWLLRSHLG
ncbi:MAG: ferritin [Rubritepida sp.]|nr:ferritin [Rubritepida sp.]